MSTSDMIRKFLSDNRTIRNKSINMPLENLEEEGLEKNPDLQLAQWRFLLTTDKYKNDRQIKNDLLDAVKEDSKYNSRFSDLCSVESFSSN